MSLSYWYKKLSRNIKPFGLRAAVLLLPLLMFGAFAPPIYAETIVVTEDDDENIELPDGGTVFDVQVNPLDPFYYEFSGIISGTGSLTKTGLGELFLNNTGNTYTGATIVTAGTLRIANQGAINADALGNLVSGAGSVLMTDAELMIANLGIATLDIVNGGSAVAVHTNIGSGVGSHGTITVSGVGSSLQVSSHLMPGLYGKGDLAILGGATASADTVGIGRYAGSVGSIEISDTGSNLNAISRIVVGWDGTGFLKLANGATSNSLGFSIGDGLTGYGRMDVTGDGSKFIGTGDSSIGFSGGTGYLFITDEGVVEIGVSMTVGNATGSYGELMVSGTNSTLAVGHNLVVGNSGTGKLNITDGGRVEVTEAFTLGTTTSGVGTAVISGNTSYLEATTSNVGGSGQGALSIRDGAEVKIENTSVAREVASTGRIDIVGSGSQFNSTDLRVGYEGHGTINVTDGGTVDVANNANIGNLATGIGIVTVSGNGSELNVGTDGLHNLFVGDLGKGYLHIEDEGSVTVTNDLTVSLYDGSQGIIKVSGENSILDVANEIYVGRNDGTRGYLEITDGATVNVGTNLRVGQEVGAYGHVKVSGTGTLLDVGNTLYLGVNGTGNLDISDGAIVQVGYDLGLAINGNTTGIAYLRDGTSLLDVTNNINIGGTPNKMGMLGGTGTAKAATTYLLENGVLAPGDYAGLIGTLTIDGDLAIDDTASSMGTGGLRIDIGEDGVNDASDKVLVTGDVTFNGDVVLDFTSFHRAGTYEVLEVVGNVDEVAANYVFKLNGEDIAGTRAALANPSASFITDTLDVTITQVVNATLTWAGTGPAAVWDLATPNWTGAETTFLDGDVVTFNNANGGDADTPQVVTIDGTGKTVARLIITGNDTNVVFDGNILGDPTKSTVPINGALIIDSSGKVTLNGENEFAASAVLLGGGTLVLGSDRALGTYETNTTMPTESRGQVTVAGTATIGIEDHRVISNRFVVSESLTFDLDAGKTLTIENVHNTAAADPDDKGGAIYLGDAVTQFSLNDTTFRNNQAGYGGGALYFANTGTSTLTYGGDSKFTGNTVVNYTGGAIYSAGPLTLTNTGGGTLSFTGNVTTGQIQEGLGGAIYADGNVTIDSGVTFGGSLTTDGNLANQGGAIYLDTNASQLSLTGTTFKNNTTNSFGYGGAVYFKRIGINTLTNTGDTSFIGNTATLAGGAIFTDGSLVIANTGTLLFSGNMTTTGGTGYGAAIDVDGDLTLGNNIIFSENAVSGGLGSGGALYLDGNGSLSLSGNTFFENNSAGLYGGAVYITGGTSTLSLDATGGHIAFTGNTANNAANSIYLENSVAIELAGSSNVYFDDPIAGSVGGSSLTMDGTGFVQFAGISYLNPTDTDGTVTVNSGTVRIVENGALASGSTLGIPNFTLNTAGTLAGNGTFTAQAGFLLNGTISPDADRFEIPDGIGTTSVQAARSTVDEDKKIGTLRFEGDTEFDGATLVFDLAAGNSSDKIVVMGDVSHGGDSTIRLSNWETGSFEIMTATDGIDKDKFVVEPAIQTGRRYAELFSTDTQLVLEADENANVSLTWTGGTGDWNTTATNWTGPDGVNRFIDGDTVNFVAAGAGTVTVDAGGVQVSGMNITGGTYVFTGGTITGTTDMEGDKFVPTGMLNVTAGSVTFENALGFSYGIDISAGASVTFSGTGNRTDTTNIDNEGTVHFNPSEGATYTYGGIISGAGTVAKNGSGAMVLSGENTATGTFYQNAGSVLLRGNWGGDYTQAAAADTFENDQASSIVGTAAFYSTVVIKGDLSVRDDLILDGTTDIYIGRTSAGMDIYIADSATAVTTLAAGTILHSDGNLVVGQGEAGTLILNTGALASFGSNISIGDVGSGSVMLLGGETTRLTTGDSIYIAGGTESVLGGTGTLEVSIGSVVLGINGVLSPGDTAGAIGTLHIEGSMDIDGGILQVDLSATDDSSDLIAATGDVRIDNIIIDITSWQTGTYTILTSDTMIDDPADNYTVTLNGAALAGRQNATVELLPATDSPLLLTTFSNNFILTWNTTDGAWDTTSENWSATGDPTIKTFVDGDTVAFGGTGAKTVTLGADRRVSDMTVSDGEYTFSGTGKITGDKTVNGSNIVNPAGQLAISGTGTVVNLNVETDFESGISIDGATVVPGHDKALGTLASNGVVFVGGGATLKTETNRLLNNQFIVSVEEEATIDIASGTTLTLDGTDGTVGYGIDVYGLAELRVASGSGHLVFQNVVNGAASVSAGGLMDFSNLQSLTVTGNGDVTPVTLLFNNVEGEIRFGDNVTMTDNRTKSGAFFAQEGKISFGNNVRILRNHTEDGLLGLAGGGLAMELELSGNTLFQDNLAALAVGAGALVIANSSNTSRSKLTLDATGGDIAFQGNKSGVDFTDTSNPTGGTASSIALQHTDMIVTGSGNVYLDDPIKVSNGGGVDQGGNLFTKTGTGFIQFVGDSVLNSTGVAGGTVSVTSGTFRVVDGASFTTEGNDASFTVSTAAALAGGGTITAENGFTISGTVSPDVARFEIPAVLDGSAPAPVIADGDRIGMLILTGDTTFAGATLQIDLNNGSSDLIVVDGDITFALNGTTKNSLDIGLWSVGTYVILSGGNVNDITDLFDDVTVGGGALGSRQSAVLSRNAVDAELLLTTTDGHGLDLLWAGTASDLWNTTDANWNGGETFVDDDYVTFDATGMNQDVDIAGTVQVSGMKVTSGTYRFIGTGSIIGTAPASTGQTVTGKLELANSFTTIINVATDFAGGTEISTGTVVVGHDSAFGQLGAGDKGHVKVLGNASLATDANRTLNNRFTVQNGAALQFWPGHDTTLTLDGTNSTAGALLDAADGTIRFEGTDARLVVRNAAEGAATGVSLDFATLSGTVFSGNAKTGSGGAVFVTESLSVSGNTLFSNNSATVSGAAVYLAGSGTSNFVSLDAEGGDIAWTGNTAGGTANSIHLERDGELRLSGSGNIYFDDPISAGAAGGNSLNKTGTGFVQFVGANVLNSAGTPAGTVSVTAGTFRVVDGASFTTQGNDASFAVSPGAVLAGGGSITAQRGFTISGTVSPDRARFAIPPVLDGSAPAPVIANGDRIGTLTLTGDTTFAGASLQIDLDTSANDRIDVDGDADFALNGTTKNSLDIGLWSVGTYTILSATGTAGDITDLFDDVTIGGSALGSRQSAVLSRNANGDALILTTAGGGNLDLLWTGAASGSWNTTDANWSSGATYNADDYVTFDATGLERSVDIAGLVQVSGMKITGGDYTFDGAGSIVGTAPASSGQTVTGKLELTAAGTTTINLATDFVNGTEISAGTVVAGHDSAFGQLGIGDKGHVEVTGNATLGTEGNRTLNNRFTIRVGAELAVGIETGTTLTLDGTNSGAGALLDASAGSLRFGDDNACLHIRDANDGGIEAGTLDLTPLAGTIFSGNSKNTPGAAISVSDSLALGGNTLFRDNTSVGGLGGAIHMSGDGATNTLELRAAGGDIAFADGTPANTGNSIRFEKNVSLLVSGPGNVYFDSMIGNVSAGNRFTKTGTGFVQFSATATLNGPGSGGSVIVSEGTLRMAGGTIITSGDESFVQIDRDAALAGHGTVTAEQGFLIYGTVSPDADRFEVPDGLGTAQAAAARTTVAEDKRIGRLELVGDVMFSGATLRIDLDSNLSDTITVDSAVFTLDGTRKNTVDIGLWSEGTYAILDSTVGTVGDITGLFDVTFNGNVLGSRQSATLSLSGTQQLLLTTAGSGNRDLVWTGAAGSAWNTTDSNWAAGDSYNPDDYVTFDASAQSRTVTIDSAVQVSGMKVTGDGFRFDGTGSIIGTAPASSGQTVTGKLELLAAGTTTIDVATDFVNGTEISAGTVVVGRDSAFGQLGSGEKGHVKVLGNATLATESDRTLNNQITVQNNAELEIAVGAGTTLTVDGTNSTGGALLDASAGSLRFSGNDSCLHVRNANHGGIEAVSADLSPLAGVVFSGNSASTGGSAIFVSDSLTLGGNTLFTNNTSTDTPGGAVHMAGTGTTNVLTLNAEGGDIAFTGNTAQGRSHSIHLGQNTEFRVSGSGNTYLDDPITSGGGGNSFRKTGAGFVQFVGDNTLNLTGAPAGTVSVTDGIFRIVDGSSFITRGDAASFTVASGAVLAGGGSIEAERGFSISGTISPDRTRFAVPADLAQGGTPVVAGTDRIGILTLTGNVHLDAAMLRIDLDGTDSDRIVIDGDLSYGTDSRIDLGTWSTGVYTILTGGLIDLSHFDSDVTLNGFSLGSRQSATLSVQGGNLLLTTRGAGNFDLVWTGENGSSWNTTARNWADDQTYNPGDFVIFDASAVNRSVTVEGDVQVSGMEIRDGHYRFDGGKITGTLATSFGQTVTGRFDLLGGSARLNLETDFVEGIRLAGGTLTVVHEKSLGTDTGAGLRGTLEVVGDATLQTEADLSLGNRIFVRSGGNMVAGIAEGTALALAGTSHGRSALTVENEATLQFTAGSGSLSVSGAADSAFVNHGTLDFTGLRSLQISGNATENSGAAIVTTGTLILPGNTLLAGNTAAGSGGAVHAENAGLTFRAEGGDIAFTGNTAGGASNSLHLEANTSLALAGSGNVYFDDPISSGAGGNSLHKTGSGFVQFVGDSNLNSAGTPAGTVSVTAGIFRVVEGASFRAAGLQSTFTLASGGTLAGGGTVSSENGFDISGTISPDADRFSIPGNLDGTNTANVSPQWAVGTFRLTGDVRLDGATLAVDLDESNVSDRVRVEGDITFGPNENLVSLYSWTYGTYGILSATGSFEAIDDRFRIEYLGETVETAWLQMSGGIMQLVVSQYEPDNFHEWTIDTGGIEGDLNPETFPENVLVHYAGRGVDDVTVTGEIPMAGLIATDGDYHFHPLVKDDPDSKIVIRPNSDYANQRFNGKLAAMNGVRLEIEVEVDAEYGTYLDNASITISHDKALGTFLQDTENDENSAGQTTVVGNSEIAVGGEITAVHRAVLDPGATLYLTGSDETEVTFTAVRAEGIDGAAFHLARDATLDIIGYTNVIGNETTGTGGGIFLDGATLNLDSSEGGIAITGNIDAQGDNDIALSGSGNTITAVGPDAADGTVIGTLRAVPGSTGNTLNVATGSFIQISGDSLLNNAAVFRAFSLMSDFSLSDASAEQEAVRVAAGDWRVPETAHFDAGESSLVHVDSAGAMAAGGTVKATQFEIAGRLDPDRAVFRTSSKVVLDELQAGTLTLDGRVRLSGAELTTDLKRDNRSDKIVVTGAMTFADTSTVNVNAWQAGTFVVLESLDGFTEDVAALHFGNVLFGGEELAGDRLSVTLSTVGDTLVLETAVSRRMNLRWTGNDGDGLLNMASTGNWVDENGNAARFAPTDFLYFDATGRQGTITLGSAEGTTGGRTVSGVVFSGGDYALEGGDLFGVKTAADDGNLIVADGTVGFRNNAFFEGDIQILGGAEVTLTGRNAFHAGERFFLAETASLTLQPGDDLIRAENVDLDGTVVLADEPVPTTRRSPRFYDMIVSTGASLDADRLHEIFDHTVGLLNRGAVVSEDGRSMDLLYTATPLDEYARRHDFTDNETAYAEYFRDTFNLWEMEELELELMKLDDGQLESLFSELSGASFVAEARQAALSNPYRTVSRHFVEESDTLRMRTGIIRSNDPRSSRSTNNFWFVSQQREVEQDGDGNAESYRISRTGLYLGGDRRISPKLLAGFLFGYGNPKLHRNGDRIETDDLTFAGYVKYRPDSDWDLNVFVGYGNQEYETRRWILGEKAEGSFGGDSFHTTLEVVRNIRLTRHFVLLPTGGLDFQKAWVDAFEESGARFSQRYEKDDLDRTTLRFGLNTRWYPSYRTRLDTRLQYGRHLDGDGSASLRTALAGSSAAPMTLRGVAVGRDVFNVGVGGHVMLGDMGRSRIYGNYDFDRGNRSKAHTGELGFQHTW